MGKIKRDDRIQIKTSEIIEYQPAWRDHTGPFGGAYRWAQTNMEPFTEVCGVLVERNDFNIPEFFKFKLLKGNGINVIGTMETRNYRHYSMRAGQMGLVDNNERWIKRWILVDGGGIGRSIDFVWQLEWELQRVFSEMTENVPTDPQAMMGQISHLIHSKSNMVPPRNWSVECFGTPFRLLHRSPNAYIVQGQIKEEHRDFYHHFRSLYEDLNGRCIDNEMFDEFVRLGKALHADLTAKYQSRD